MPNSDRTLNIVGEGVPNPDGGQRQAEIKRCQVGEPVELRRETGKRYDAHAVAVISCRGIQIGYLKAEHARWIGGRLDKGSPMPAIIERINGGTPDRPSLGVSIRLNVEGIPPTPARRGWLDRLFGR